MLVQVTARLSLTEVEIHKVLVGLQKVLLQLPVGALLLCLDLFLRHEAYRQLVGRIQVGSITKTTS